MKKKNEEMEVFNERNEVFHEENNVSNLLNLLFEDIHIYSWQIPSERILVPRTSEYF